MTGNLRLARRYARALGDLAHERGALDQVEQELARIASLIQQDADIRAVVESQRLSPDVKADLLARAAGDQISDITRLFLRLVVQKRRERYLADMYREYVSYADRMRNMVEVEVRSATPLDEEELARLEKSLGAFTGKRVRIKNVVAPEILGGVVARIGDVVMDGSVARRLARLKETLRRSRLEHVG
ncbi:MAG: ATP synthase F1 subunit delta [Firmicutes bacterium]|nr:ATP synthase F1 subunit delta [Bacillota bacterium]